MKSYSLFGKNEIIPLGDSFWCANSLLISIKRFFVGKLLSCVLKHFLSLFINFFH